MGEMTYSEPYMALVLLWLTSDKDQGDSPTVGKGLSRVKTLVGLYGALTAIARQYRDWPPDTGQTKQSLQRERDQEVGEGSMLMWRV